MRRSGGRKQIIDPIITNSVWIPILLAVIAWFVLSQTPALGSCQQYSFFALLWPPNISFFRQLSGTNVGDSYKCVFINMNSTISAIMLFWMVGRIIYSIKTKMICDSGKSIPVALALLFLVAVSFIGFRPGDAWYELSVNFSMTWNIFINAPIIIGIYICLGELISHVIAFIRQEMR